MQSIKCLVICIINLRIFKTRSAKFFLSPFLLSFIWAEYELCHTTFIQYLSYTCLCTWIFQRTQFINLPTQLSHRLPYENINDTMKYFRVKCDFGNFVHTCGMIHGSWLTLFLVIAPRNVSRIFGVITMDKFSNLVSREDVTKYQQG